MENIIFHFARGPTTCALVGILVQFKDFVMTDMHKQRIVKMEENGSKNRDNPSMGQTMLAEENKL